MLYSVEVELTRLLGSWIARTPEFPEKLTLARMIYDDACHASLLDTRLGELRVAPESRELFRRRSVDGLLLLEHLDDASAFLAVLVRVVKPALLAEYKRHVEASPPYVDDPTRRMLKQVIAEEEEHIEAGMALLAEREIGWPAYQEIEARVRAGLWKITAANGGMKQGDYAEALRRAREALQAFKGQHQAESQESPIPLVRLGLDETSHKRTVNITAKRLVGFTDQEIEALATQAGQTLTEDEA